MKVRILPREKGDKVNMSLVVTATIISLSSVFLVGFFCAKRTHWGIPASLLGVGVISAVFGVALPLACKYTRESGFGLAFGTDDVVRWWHIFIAIMGGAIAFSPTVIFHKLPLRYATDAVIPAIIFYYLFALGMMIVGLVYHNIDRRKKGGKDGS